MARRQNGYRPPTPHRPLAIGCCHPVRAARKIDKVGIRHMFVYTDKYTSPAEKRDDGLGNFATVRLEPVMDNGQGGPDSIL